MKKFYYINPYYHATMVDHYNDRMLAAKTWKERIFLKEQLMYHELMYQATQN
jgi:hypothetical protein